MRPVFPILLLACAAAAPAQARQADSLRLADLHRQASASDARQRQFGLYENATTLRLRNLSSQRLPQLRLEGSATHMSDPFAGMNQSGTSAAFSPPRNTYENRVVVEQSLLDRTIGAQQDLADAELAESQAGVRTALFALRQEVNDAFFGAALLAEQGRLIAASIGELHEQLADARIRCREGTALPSDTAAIQAALLQRRQDAARVTAERRAALTRLAELIGRQVPGDAGLALPDLAGQAADARGSVHELRSRPEHAQYAAARERIERQRDAVAAELRPRLSAFARAGVGRPGMNPVQDVTSYYVVGIQMRWTPFTWGSNGREREQLAAQRQIADADEAAFTARLARAVQQDLADMDRLDTALALDDEIVALRDRVETETRLRFREGVVTASEYTDRSTDALEARLARASHRIELVQARARFLTTLGLEIL